MVVQPMLGVNGGLMSRVLGVHRGVVGGVRSVPHYAVRRVLGVHCRMVRRI